MMICVCNGNGHGNGNGTCTGTGDGMYRFETGALLWRPSDGRSRTCTGASSDLEMAYWKMAAMQY